MPKLVGVKERMWKVLYDTIAFSDAPPEHLIPTFRAGSCHNLFGRAKRVHYSNIEGNGLSSGASFRLGEFGLRADLDGPIAEDMLHALLRSTTVQLFVGERECFAIPPGGFYPPGMTETVANFVEYTERNNRDIAGDEIKPLVARHTDHDESAQLWAAEANALPGVYMFFPSSTGVEIGSRERLDMQLHARGGRVTFEQSNNGEDWLDVTRSVVDRGAEDTKGNEWYGGLPYKFALFYHCTAKFFRASWLPTNPESAIRLDVLTRGGELVLNNDLDDLEPPWLRGGYCRFVPVRPTVTLTCFQHFRVELTFDGPAARTLEKAHAEGLLRGELAVLLGGVYTRDIL
jgi:hypothetical protein